GARAEHRGRHRGAPRRPGRDRQPALRPPDARPPLRTDGWHDTRRGHRHGRAAGAAARRRRSGRRGHVRRGRHVPRDAGHREARRAVRAAVARCDAEPPDAMSFSFADLGTGALRAALPLAIWGLGAAAYAAAKRDGRALPRPLLYLGYVLFSVPFAYAIASLILGEGGDRWLVATRRFALVSWALLGVGIVAGSWWSYAVLGWGGYWAWDPVENAAIMPWLTSTAYLHSVMVEEKRSLLRTWNLALVVATFALTILGTLLTRSGVVNSVHSFSLSAIGPILLGYLVAILVLSG